MSVAVAQVVDSIKRNTNLSASAIAQLVGTTRQTLSRWAAAEHEPQLEYLKRLLELDYVAAQLVEFLEPDQVKLWLLRPHAQLGNARPADLLGAGRLDDVIVVVARQRK